MFSPPSDIYLDRHAINCPDNGLLSGFKLSRGGTLDKIKYDFSCCDVPAASAAKCFTRSTDWKTAGKGRTYFLDRHDVDCGAAAFLSEFAMKVKRARKIKYTYKCCELPNVKMVCQSRYTEMNQDGGGNVIFLDRHDVSCGNEEFLTRIHLSRGGTEDQIRYEYTCCSYQSEDFECKCFDGFTPDEASPLHCVMPTAMPSAPLTSTLG